MQIFDLIIFFSAWSILSSSYPSICVVRIRENRVYPLLVECMLNFPLLVQSLRKHSRPTGCFRPNEHQDDFARVQGFIGGRIRILISVERMNFGFEFRIFEIEHFEHAFREFEIESQDLFFMFENVSSIAFVAPKWILVDILQQFDIVIVRGRIRPKLFQRRFFNPLQRFHFHFDIDGINFFGKKIMVRVRNELGVLIIDE